MKVVYIASVTSYAGKSLAALGIGLCLRERGYKVGYFKPVGSLPAEAKGTITDEDALFISQRLDPAAPVEALCPVLLTEELTSHAFAGRLEPLDSKIRDALCRVAKGKDVVLAGGLGDLSRGALFGLCAPAVAELLDARALIVANYKGNSTVEDIILARQVLADRFLGVVFNSAAAQHMEHLSEHVKPHLEARGLAVLGVLPQDEVIGSITARELAQHLGAKVLAGEKGLDELIKRFVVGAMSVSSAIRYFRDMDDKAVITGGDRPDIQLAALQTSTRALVLTGNLYPSAPLIQRANQLGVPILLVGDDTLATVGHIEDAMGRLRVRGETKVQRAKELMEEHFDLDRFASLLGLKKRS